MANSTSLVLANLRPLTTDDASGVMAAVLPESTWQPTGLLETDFSTEISVATSGLASSGDRWLIRVAPPSKVPGSIFYPVAMRAMLKGAGAGWEDFWEPSAAYSINTLGPQYWWHWDQVTLTDTFNLFDTAVTWFGRCANPVFHGFPVRENQTTSPTIANNALGGFTFTVKTWDATTAASAEAHIDARWLVFPVSVDKNAGFYTDRLTFTPS